MMTALPVHSPSQPTRVARLFSDMRSGSSSLWVNAWITLALFVACSALTFFDMRLLNGVSVWEKPAKFYLSISIHMLTIAWALNLVSKETRQLRSVRWAVTTLVCASWVELAIISGQSFRGVGSHFNTATAIDGALYSIMGVGAILLTLTSGIIGFRIWRQRNAGLWPEAAGLGLMLGAILTTLVAGYMSSQPGGHWVGGDLTDATGLPFFHWSTTGGDLRVPHFIALHATQLVPLAAATGSRGIIYATTLGLVVLTVMTFVQAVLGIPLLRA